jgi:hypothetical protein
MLKIYVGYSHARKMVVRNDFFRFGGYDSIYLASLLYRRLYWRCDKTASYHSGIPGPGGIQLKVDDKVIVAGIAIVVVLAIIAIIGAACCACVFCVSTTSWNWGNWGGYSAQTEHKTVTYTPAAADNIELYVDTIGGDVDIVQSAVATSVTITYDVYAPVGHLDNLVTTTDSASVDNNTVRITAKAERKSGIFSGSYGAGITVTVPKNSSYYLNLHTLGGAITVSPLHGSAVYMDTLGGKLNLNGGRYDTVYMNTAGGDIHASYEASNVTLKTVGGNIEADTTQTAGTLYANTLGGNIQVRLPADTLFTIDASTFGGRVRHGSIRMSATTDRDSALVGSTEGGAGSLKVTLKTMGGNIDIGY